MKSLNLFLSKLICSVIPFLLLCQTGCKDDDKPNKDGTIYLWCSDQGATFPIDVTFTVDGVSSGKSYILKRLDKFNCNNWSDVIYQNAFVSKTELSNQRIYYTAKDKRGVKWSGSIFPSENSCKSFELTNENMVHTGAFFWSQTGKVLYPIHVALTNIDSGYITGKSIRNLTCDSAIITNQPYYWCYIDTVGVFSYHAKAASGETWDGKVTLVKDHCSAVELLGDTAAIKCIQANLIGSWVRQDDGLYPNTKGMIISYDQFFGGTVTFAPSKSCYKALDPIWTILNSNDCTISEIEFNTACKYTATTNAAVNFITLKLISINGVQYKKQ